MSIKILNNKISPEELQELCDEYFGTFVKFVVDIEKEIIAIGGELHADAEAELLERGSMQKNIWGANYYPYRDAENRVEYTALINIRPRDDNPAMEILDDDICAKVRSLAEEYILAPDEGIPE